MNELPSMDLLTASLAIAVCDLLISETAKVKAIVQLLERKGLLSSAEIREAIQSIASLPPEVVEAESQRLQEKIRERMTTRLQELMRHMTSSGPARA